jgi:hypothetical protein
MKDNARQALASESFINEEDLASRQKNSGG